MKVHICINQLAVVGRAVAVIARACVGFTFTAVVFLFDLFNWQLLLHNFIDILTMETFIVNGTRARRLLNILLFMSSLRIEEQALGPEMTEVWTLDAINELVLDLKFS